MHNIMWLVDIFSTYLFGIKFIATLVAVAIAISSLDDLFIDIAYWSRRFWRSITIYKKHDRLTHEALYEIREKPLAIMVPAWHEIGVIGNMAQLASETIDYENYAIFVGTYPNDPETQSEVDAVCAMYPHVHKVVCARPGPTSKADCLNNVVEAILQFEQRCNIEFAGFILHDSEDVISSLELRLFNYLVDRKDLIQIPVYPFERQWHNFTSMSYMDEFAEIHGKDVVVREALAGQVPSAGVGTCFSRRAMIELLKSGDGIPFDTQSLTEDYDIGIRLKEKGLQEVFVRFPATLVSKEAWLSRRSLGMRYRASQVLCVREFFPSTVATAVRQKSRWIIGIVFQGYKTHRWTKSWILNYFLWRDRKGVFANFASFAALVILAQVSLIWLYQAVWPDAYHFMSVFSDDPLLVALFWLNLYLFANRIVQRVFFVSTYYGLFQGLLSIPRLVWGNYINCMANFRAIRQIIREGDPHRVAWDKTTHDFPSVDADLGTRQHLGQILIEHGAINEKTLEHALLHNQTGLKIGAYLLTRRMISAEALTRAIAQQAGVGYDSVDPYGIDPELIQAVPAAYALRYAVMPIRRDHDGVLFLGSESGLDPVLLAAISRKIGEKVRYVILSRAQVTVGNRHWYAEPHQPNQRAILDDAVAREQLTQSAANKLWDDYLHSQVLLAELIANMGQLDFVTLRTLFIDYDPLKTRIGNYLVEQGVITQELLEQALARQAQLQHTIPKLIASAVAQNGQISGMTDNSWAVTL